MLNRRTFLTTALAATAVTPAYALSDSGASTFVAKVTERIMRHVNSNISTSSFTREFEKIISQYVDVPVVSRSILGPAARSTSQRDLRAFSKALQGYMARKYGAQFREFKGGQLEIGRTRARGKFVEVSSKVRTPGKATVDVTFRVWDRSGSPKLIDIMVEGIGFVATERTEIGNMLKQRGGSVSRLTQDLKRLG